MQNVNKVESLHSFSHLDEDLPDEALLHVFLLSLILLYALEDITIICVLHYDAETTRCFIEKSFFVTCDVWVLNRGQYANFVQSVLFFALI